MNRFFQRKAVRYQLGQIEPVAIAAENQIGDLINNSGRCGVRTDKALFVHTDSAGIEVGFAVLGLSKEHYLAAGANSGHGGFDERIDTHCQNHYIRTSAFSGGQCALDYVFRACVDRLIQPKFRGNGVALWI